MPLLISNGFFMQGLTRKERLRNFRLRRHLFSKGKRFSCHPLRVVYLPVMPNMEPIFFPGRVQEFKGRAHECPLREKQNPSWPHLKLPENAVFIAPAQCLFSVPARQLSRAVDRNRVKRCMREAYRKNKTAFYSFLNQAGHHCLLAFIYSASEVLPYAVIEEQMLYALQEIGRRLSGPVA